ncbi:MAG: hypothetical protein ACI35S_06260 [Anaeroplasma sp.]
MEGVKNRHRYLISVIVGILAFCFACFCQYIDDSISNVEIHLLFSLLSHLIFLGILAYWIISLISRTPIKCIKLGLASTIILIAFMLISRVLKYEVFYEETICRYLWYSYYIPLCLAPSTFFITIISIDRNKFSKLSFLSFIPAVILLIMVFTNDTHQFVFSFPEGLKNGNKIYERELIYYMIVAWIIGMLFTNGILLFTKCRISHCRKKAWIPFIVFLFCILICIIREYYDFSLIKMPELIAFSIVLICESLILIGFIPTNLKHKTFFDVSNASASILDKELNVVLRSINAPAITKEQAAICIKNGALSLDSNSILRSKRIRGGNVFWLDDLKIINKINDELSKTNEVLAEEGDLIIAENKLKEQEAYISEQNRLYDKISIIFNPYLKKIEKLFIECNTNDEKKEVLKLSIIYGVYLKRRSNFIMIEKNGYIQFMELYHSFRESIDALNYYGILASVVCDGDGLFRTEIITHLYDFLEKCIEMSLPSLTTCFVRLSAQDKKIECRIIMDNANSYPKNEIENKKREELKIRYNASIQDDTIYINLIYEEECI